MISILSVCLLIVSAVRALVIVSPSQGATINKGQSFSLLVNNVNTDAASQVTVYFSTGSAIFPVVVTPGLAQNVILPATISGLTALTAVATVGTAATATSSINVIAYYPPYPYYPCYNPCYRPCVPRNPCYNPRPICKIPRSNPICNIPRPRENRCRIRVEEPYSYDLDSYESSNPNVLYSGFSVLVADNAQEEQFLQQYEQQQQQEQINAELEHEMVVQALKALAEQEELEQKQQA